MAASLLVAARSVGVLDWEQRAVDIALRATRRPAEDCGIVDAGLCHGASGLAHIFHLFHRASGEEPFAAAARAWFGRALDMRGARGPGGFLACKDHGDDAQSFAEDGGLLNGAAGVGLALLSAVSTVEPTWDRMLLLSPLAMQVEGAS